MKLIVTTFIQFFIIHISTICKAITFYGGCIADGSSIETSVPLFKQICSLIQSISIVLFIISLLGFLIMTIKQKKDKKSKKILKMKKFFKILLIISVILFFTFTISPYIFK